MPPPIADHLFENSREKYDYTLMLEEWIELNRETAHEPCDCPCGKRGIVELCYIFNVLTGYTGYVGNCCVRHIKDCIGYCSSNRCPYRCVSHAAHFCEYHARNRKDAPTGFISRGKWKGRPYNDPCLADYAKWALKERSPGVDPHYLAWLDLDVARRQYTAVLVARRRRPQNE